MLPTYSGVEKGLGPMPPIDCIILSDRRLCTSNMDLKANTFRYK